MPAPANTMVIEPGIRPLCDSLNGIPGVETRYSCEGHPRRLVPSGPFVIFAALKEVAYGLHCLLGPGHADGRLQFCWWLTARFQDDGSLIYSLETNDSRIPGAGWLAIRTWGRTAMDHDLRSMAGLIQSLTN